MAIARRNSFTLLRLGVVVVACGLSAALSGGCDSPGGSSQGDSKGVGSDSRSDTSAGDTTTDLADSIGSKPDAIGPDATADAPPDATPDSTSDAAPDAIEKLDLGPPPTPGALYPGEPYESTCAAWCDRETECLEEDTSAWRFCMYDCYAELEGDRSYDSAACFALVTPIYTCTLASLTCEDFVLTWGLDDSDEDPASDACDASFDAYDVCSEDDDGEGPHAPVPAPSTNAAVTGKLASPHEAQCVAVCDPQVRCPDDSDTPPTWLECVFDCMWEYEYATVEQPEACVTLLSSLDACIADLTCVEWNQYWDAPDDAPTGYPCAAEYVAYDAECGVEVAEIEFPPGR